MLDHTLPPTIRGRISSVSSTSARVANFVLDNTVNLTAAEARGKPLPKSRRFNLDARPGRRCATSPTSSYAATHRWKQCTRKSTRRLVRPNTLHSSGGVRLAEVSCADGQHRFDALSGTPGVKSGVGPVSLPEWSPESMQVQVRPTRDAGACGAAVQ